MFLMIFLSVLKKSALCCPETGEVPTETKLLLKKDKAVILKKNVFQFHPISICASKNRGTDQQLPLPDEYVSFQISQTHCST